MDATNLDLQINTGIGTGQVANSPRAAVIPPRMQQTACATGSFFERRSKVMIRAFGSPNTPRTLLNGRKPGNVYASRRRLNLDDVAMRHHAKIQAVFKYLFANTDNGFRRATYRFFSTLLRDEPVKGYPR
jgi:hypothetical protein